MPELVFDCLGAQPDRYAVGPTLLFRLRIAETTGAKVTAIALRCQLRIEPARRRYTPAEEGALEDLFGHPSRWGDTLKPLQLTYVTQMVPGFSGSVEVDLPVPCSYDLEVATGKYFAGLDNGNIPLLLLFSGTVFSKGETGFSVQQVPWDKEERYPLPVAVWREMMDLYFPGSGWLRLPTDTLDALGRFKSRHTLLSFDDAIQRLLKEVGEDGG
jgi:hypothetical protein